MATKALVEDGKTRNWKNIGPRIGADIVSALTAAVLIAPAITIIDKAVMESVSNTKTLLRSSRDTLIQLLTRPHIFFFSRPFGVMMILYGNTYIAANLLDTTTSTLYNKPASTVNTGFSKFATTTAVNINLAIYKDGQYSRMFGMSTPRPLPPASKMLFLVRDSLTIFASFNLPQRIAPQLPEAFDAYMSRASVAQLATPALMQWVGSPLHLLGLDLYNRNERIGLRDRLQRVRAYWPTISIARMCRVIPAFGVGGVVNNNLRANLMRRLE